MPRIRILQGVAGDDFSWSPGDEVDLGVDEAAKWADGYRAEYVDAPPTPNAKAEPDASETEETSADEAPEAAEKAVPRSRGGGRGRRTETR